MNAMTVPDGAHVGVRRWLLACIIAVYLAVVVGGITRLTESGLSITEWRPVSGVLPPTTDADWQRALDAFREIPQASATHAGITMEGFKLIYWWEWFHRILARGVGLVFAVPFVWFWVRGALPSAMRFRLMWLPLLTLGQGVLGWYMVKSGLSVRTEVSAYRLAAHLALALAILVVALWSWADLRPQREIARSRVAWQRGILGLALLIALTVVSGAFVAGLRAGRIFNEFPLMGGRIVPEGYATAKGVLANAAENPIAAQFHHRLLAVLTGVLALVAAVRARRSARDGLSAEGRAAVQILGAVVLVQVTLGIITLLNAVPAVLGALHQFVGVLALTAAVLAVHTLRGNAPD